ncbi:MAG: hypothetical protein IPH16_10185 [Haliscomenobacter sp.]|nr:hypothetical protein [Haliscomenobacter sp.]
MCGEIEIALQTQGVAILPILLNGAELPLREDLPLSIQTLFDYQSANERRPLNFNQPIIGEFEALFDRISELIGIAPQKTEGGDNLFHASLKVEFPLPQEFYKFLPARNTPFVGLKPFRREDARLFLAAAARSLILL